MMYLLVLVLAVDELCSWLAVDARVFPVLIQLCLACVQFLSQSAAHLHVVCALLAVRWQRIVHTPLFKSLSFLQASRAS